MNDKPVKYSHLIQVTDLKKHYNGGDIKALDGVSVNIDKGEVVVVMDRPGRANRHFSVHLTFWRSPRRDPYCSKVWT